MKWLMLMITLVMTNAMAQERKDIFADPQNLKVLPKDISSAELSKTMRSFAFALDARCETCHVGEAGQPLETFDFAADDKPNKETARAMLTMVNAINSEHLGMLDEPKLQVSCMTCHRGVRRPMTTEAVLTEAMSDGGVDSAVTKYKALRDQYYGTHSYDFSESVLGNLAQSLARGGDPSAALTLLELNDDYFPRSFQNHWLKGEVAMLLDDAALARKQFETALDIGSDPRSEAFLRQRLEGLD